MPTERTAAPAHAGWSSAHIHVTGANLTALDQCIESLISPLLSSGEADGWLRRAFFVRYGEGGPHVRLRMEPTNRARSHLAHEAVAEAVRRHNDRTSEKLHLQWKPYEPETERYGGPHALCIAEAFFCESSAVVMMLLRNNVGNSWSHAQRLGQGLLLMVVMAHTVAPSTAAASQLLQYYGESYLRTFAREAAADAWYSGVMVAFENQEAKLIDYVRETWQRLCGSEALTDALDQYRAATAAYLRDLHAVHDRGEGPRRDDVELPWRRVLRHCVPSLIHMTSNRLGISIAEEIYLALLAHRALTTLASRAVMA